MIEKYKNQSLIFATLHNKEIAIKEVFEKNLLFKLKTLAYNTDSLGTFTGEIERKLSQIDSAKEKALIGIKLTSEKFSIGSEGSFGPHPQIPFLASNLETLFFIDNENNIELSVSHLSNKTNYNHEIFDDLESSFNFLKKIQFPSHAVILKPNKPKGSTIFFKGIQNFDELKMAFKSCQQSSIDKKVFIQTDMRAHMNPLRMVVIKEAANLMVNKLLNQCPKCFSPGFDKIEVITGKPCIECKNKTDEPMYTIEGCIKCDYKMIKPFEENLYASPNYCFYCNP